MATHGTENDIQKKLDYQRTEIMYLNEKVLTLEAHVRRLLDRLDIVEAELGRLTARQ